MRYSREIAQSISDHRYQSAKTIFDEIKHGHTPSENLLSDLFPPDLVKIVKDDLELFFANNSLPDKKVRQHIDTAPTEISDARSKAEKMPSFQALHSALLTRRKPDELIVKEFYGEYADFAQLVFEMFRSYKMFRKCGLPSAAHLNRVGAISSIININDPGSKLYSAIAVGHDLIEDMLYKAVDEFGVHYGFDRYDEFIHKFIPEELREGIAILTNHYDLIIKYVIEFLDERGVGINNGTILYALETLMTSEHQLLSKYAGRTLEVLKGLPAETKDLEVIRWVCYKDLYLKDIAQLSKKVDNFRFYEIKSFDLSDNGHCIGSLSMDARMKNLLKQEAWAREGYLFQTEWEPINRRIMELHEDILVFAEYFVIRDLMEYQSIQDFLFSALHKIKSLEKIFYID
ncbi:MAG: hypothetical protein IT278_12635 [Ignavibacteriaceae bacterium]|nr:hypothetical protein [Ignavibacteriaceae bacterium]